ncbi:hypothetical protein BKA61DRAFT_729857 [Leptodontidium sp. MPI-SDFR-AT-0119]|nr:hypothetical protein BKA61DRAFT_729857 [Leptodontidium sp. MPI-SDFR-AT-0119]
MKLTTLFTTIPTPTLLLLPTISLAAPGSSSDYTTTRLLITGSTHNGTPLNGAGTIEEILAQVTAENPHFQIPDTSSIAERTVEFHNDANQGNLNCIPVKGQDWRPAKSTAISTGIEYLNSLKAICWVQPHSCTRISCSYNSAIYLYMYSPHCLLLPSP